MKVPRPENRNAQSSAIPVELEATTQAVFEADHAYIHQAIGSAQWERRGLLQRLIRADRQRAEAGLSTELATG